MAPKVSVIIPAYNAERFIKETIESVLRQTYDDFEIIIVDDGSTDTTRQIIESLNDQRIIYLYQKNSGVSVARNTGVSKARGEYIALLDHDDLWLPEKLKKQIPLLETHTEIGLVYSDCYIIDLKGRILTRIFQSFNPCRGKVSPHLLLCNFVPCLTAVIRKNILQKIDMFNPKFCIAEEFELFLRLSEISEFDFVDIPLAKYRVHETNFSKNEVLGCSEALSVVTSFLERHPELRNIIGNKVVNKYEASLYYKLGQAYFFNGEMKKTFYYFNKSKRIYRYSFTLILFKLLSFFPPDCIRKLRQLKLKMGRY